MMADRHKFTAEVRDHIRLRYPDATNEELAREIEHIFGVHVERHDLINQAKKQGLRKSEETKRRTREQAADKYRKYGGEQIEFFRTYIPGHCERDIRDEYERRFGERITRHALSGVKTMLGVKSGTCGGQFRKGDVPANKGKTWDEYMSAEAQERVRSAGSMFKKGGRAHNRKYELLDIKTDKIGTWIYVRPRDAKKSVDLWMSYARFVWMQTNGRDFPEGCHCVFCDHDNANFSPENIMAVPDDLYGIITGCSNRGEIEYWDRESLKLAIIHAKLIRTRTEVARTRPRRCEVCGKVFRPTGSRYRYGNKVRTCDECRAKGLKAPKIRRVKAKVPTDGGSDG